MSIDRDGYVVLGVSVTSRALVTSERIIHAERCSSISVHYTYTRILVISSDPLRFSLFKEQVMSQVSIQGRSVTQIWGDTRSKKWTFLDTLKRKSGPF